MECLLCDYIRHKKKHGWTNQFVMNGFSVTLSQMKNIRNKKGLSPKAFLLLNKASAHPSEFELVIADSLIFVHHLPPSVTSLIQPMDHGVIISVKRAYKNHFSISYSMKIMRKILNKTINCGRLRTWREWSKWNRRNEHSKWPLSQEVRQKSGFRRRVWIGIRVCLF